MESEFKFINIAPWRIRNADWLHLPESAETCEHGLFLIGTGRYRESQACLAYVPLPDGGDPVFSEWRFLAGYGDPGERTGPCGRPLWSIEQKDAIYLWDDREFFPLFDPNPIPGQPDIRRTTPRNAGVLGEISMAFLPSVGLFVALYHGTKLRSAEFPWGPWSDPVALYDFGRDHRKVDPGPNDPPDLRPQYVTHGRAYGPYIVPRFTEHDPVLGETTIYHALSWDHDPYQVMLLRTRVRLNCGGPMIFACGKKGEIL